MAQLQLLLLRVRDEVEEVPQWTLEKSRHRLPVPLDIGSAHEFELGDLDKLAEADHETPGVRALRLQPLNEYGAHLLMHDVLLRLHINVEDNTAEVESVVVRVPQLIDDSVEESAPSFVAKVAHGGFEGLSCLPLVFPVRIRSRLLLVCLPVGDEKDNGADDVRVNAALAVDDLLRSLHLQANLVDKLWPLCPCVCLQVVFQAHQVQVAVVVGEYAGRLLNLIQQVDLEILAEGVWLLDV